MEISPKLADKGYRFVEQLGGGGQSNTYILEKDSQFFLLKQPQSDKLSTEQRFRFKQEAYALSMLEGKSAPKVIEYSFEDGQPYIVMEYINGQTLSSFVNGKP